MPNAISKDAVGDGGWIAAKDQGAVVEGAVEKDMPRQVNSGMGESNLLVNEQARFCHCDPWGEWDANCVGEVGAAWRK